MSEAPEILAQKSQSPQLAAVDQSGQFPDGYDIEGSAFERVEAMTDLVGEIDLLVSDGDTAEFVGRLKDHMYRDNGQTHLLKTGGDPDRFDWEWEIIVPKQNGESQLVDVDPNQDLDEYQEHRQVYLTDIDICVVVRLT